MFGNGAVIGMVTIRVMLKLIHKGPSTDSDRVIRGGANGSDAMPRSAAFVVRRHL